MDVGGGGENSHHFHVLPRFVDEFAWAGGGFCCCVGWRGAVGGDGGLGFIFHPRAPLVLADLDGGQ